MNRRPLILCTANQLRSGTLIPEARDRSVPVLFLAAVILQFLSGCASHGGGLGGFTVVPTAPGSLVYVGNHDNKQGELYLYDDDTRLIRRLTNNRFAEAQPDISPDGRMLAFATERDHNVDVYVMDLVSGSETRLTYSPVWDLGPSFSHDGRRIVYFNSKPGNLVAVYASSTARIVNVDGSNDHALARADLVADPSLWRAVDGTLARTQRALGIWEFNPRATAHVPYYSWFFPNGKDIVYVTGEEQDQFDYDLYVMDIHERKPARITHGAHYINSVEIAPDASRVFFSAPNLGPDGPHDYLLGWIYSVRPDGSELRALVPVYGPLRDGRPTGQQPVNGLITSAT